MSPQKFQKILKATVAHLAFISLLSAHGIDARAENGLFQQPSEALTSYVSTYAQPLDLAAITAGYRLVYFGEHHPDPISKSFLADKMAELKKLGFTYLGLEMFDSTAQEMLNRFAKYTATDEELLSYLREKWFFIPDYYLRLVRAARKEDVKVVALDYRPNTNTVFIDKRDQHMAKIITQTLKRKDRMVVLIGSSHVNSFGSKETQYQPDIIRSRHGIRSISYVISEKYTLFRIQQPIPLLPSDPMYDHGISFNFREVDVFAPNNLPTRQALKQLSISTEGTFLPTSRKDSGFDGVIFSDQYYEHIPDWSYREDT